MEALLKVYKHCIVGYDGQLRELLSDIEDRDSVLQFLDSRGLILYSEGRYWWNKQKAMPSAVMLQSYREYKEEHPTIPLYKERCTTKRKAKQRVRRAYSVAEVLKYRPNVVSFTDRWKALIGQPELTGVWLVWGNSGNGKTSFALQLAKYLCEFTTVVYNSIEEGLSLSMQRSIQVVDMTSVTGFTLLDKEPLAETLARLSKRRSPGVVIIDSLQYCGLDKNEVKRLTDEYPTKLFVFISHASGKEPNGKTAMAVRYHANVKIRVEGFRAYCVSRYADSSVSEPYVIWDEGV